MIKHITTTEEFEGLHNALDKVRSTSKTITVSKAALTHLLMDHSNMTHKLDGVTIS